MRLHGLSTVTLSAVEPYPRVILLCFDKRQSIPLGRLFLFLKDDASYVHNILLHTHSLSLFSIIETPLTRSSGHLYIHDIHQNHPATAVNFPLV